MDAFERLAQAVCRQNAEGELPDFIVPLLPKVADGSKPHLPSIARCLLTSAVTQD